MSIDRILTIVFGCIAVLSILLGLWGARHWGNPRLKMLVSFEAAPLIPKLNIAGPQRLKMSFDGVELQNPYIATIRLTNIGAGDIGSGQYDQGKPIIVSSNTKFYGLIRGDALLPDIGDDTAIRFPPTLQKCGTTREAVVIVSGPPKTGSPHNRPTQETAIVPDFMIPLVNVQVMYEVNGSRTENSIGAFGKLVGSMIDLIAEPVHQDVARPDPSISVSNGIMTFSYSSKL